MESTENVYHVKRQNLHFAHALHNKRSKKKKKKKRQLRKGRLDSEIIIFGLDEEDFTSSGQRQCREMNNRLCKLSIA